MMGPRHLYPSPFSHELLDALEDGYEQQGWTREDHTVPDFKAVRDIIAPAIVSNPCVYWVENIWSKEDASKPENFQPNDVDHLSPKGAQIFTSRLVERMRKLTECEKQG